MNADPGIRYRPMVEQDIEHVPLDCQGERGEISARIHELGSSAILAYDGDQHVGQLQFRRHDAALKSPSGIWHPDYWGDFGDTQPDVPPDTLGIFCYHVGQLGPGDDRDERYFGRGIGQALLDHFLAWAASQRVSCIVAKHTPPSRPVMALMGGQPAGVYEARGFEIVSSWIDPQLLETVRERDIVEDSEADAEIAKVGMCVRYLR